MVAPYSMNWHTRRIEWDPNRAAIFSQPPRAREPWPLPRQHSYTNNSHKPNNLNLAPMRFTQGAASSDTCYGIDRDVVCVLASTGSPSVVIPLLCCMPTTTVVIIGGAVFGAVSCIGAMFCCYNNRNRICGEDCLQMTFGNTDENQRKDSQTTCNETTPLVQTTESKAGNKEDRPITLEVKFKDQAFVAKIILTINNKEIRPTEKHREIERHKKLFGNILREILMLHEPDYKDELGFLRDLTDRGLIFENGILPLGSKGKALFINFKDCLHNPSLLTEEIEDDLGIPCLLTEEVEGTFTSITLRFTLENNHIVLKETLPKGASKKTTESKMQDIFNLKKVRELQTTDGRTSDWKEFTVTITTPQEGKTNYPISVASSDKLFVYTFPLLPATAAALIKTNILKPANIH